MTSRPSSISSSDLKRYLAALGATALLLAAPFAAFTIAGYRLGLVDTQNSVLVGEKEKMIAAAQAVDTVFLGDSSLGCAIDADLVSDLSGGTALNLALTGAYGYGGSYNMLRKVLERHRPRLVVLVQTINMITRAQSPAGLYFTSDGLSGVSPLDVMKIYLDFGAAKRAYRTLAAKGWHLPDPSGVADARTTNIERRPSIDDIVRQPFGSETINPRGPYLLAKIAALCRRAGTSCIYAHGPIFDGFCDTERAYIERATNRIRESGLAVLEGTPLCVPKSDLLDTVDHVKPAVRGAYTRRYVDLLKAQVPDWGRVAARSVRSPTTALAGSGGD